jgi:hypothetical protein
VARDSERTEDAPWDELEQGFFAAAPPDVPVPPAEPMRFDDLDPLPTVATVAPVAPEFSQHRRADAARRLAAWRASAAVSAAAAWRRLTPAVGVARRRLTPAVGVASVAARRSALRLAVFARLAIRVGQAQMPRLLAVFRNSSRRTRVLAAGVAALIAVTGVSVASRGSGGGRALPTIHAQPAIASSRTVASEVAAPPVAMTLAPDEDPRPASASIGTSVTTPSPRKRKHTKAASRQPARATVLSKSSNGPSARPAPGP